MELRQRALQVLCLTDPEQKSAQTLDMYVHAAQFSIDAQAVLAPPPGIDLPGRPERPVLLKHTEVGRRSPATPEGRAVLMHAIAHIEFNAINLALDAIWRFEDMPGPFYLDWLRVAGEEAKHFRLLRDHLRDMGHDYGDFPAHQGLWTMCEKTAGDIVARMALVPRTLEARGLDATPLIQKKLRHIGAPDALAAAAILDIILEEEIGHVAIGNHWYRWLCSRDGHEPLTHFAELTRVYEAPRPKPPLNEAARRAAGFSDEELLWLNH
ncbi:ferritin-like domain-containing protein [Diaphorobacter ruginosibacter]|uniref:Ferritin-like domain-containing protein n=1 Tax=Diaphorobacter ruginosibacter TaxID=1715720 RepID=A0A7G9RRW3_9BURK|nr:ferritin-like domain-containing protein [Diaphorobacter ruginosibacter]QNN58338.1 ferritin-like domain-containing protein [Diaphorobacter ruginosibacter]